MRWRAEGEMKWVWQDDWGPACRPHTSNFLVISFPCNFSIFIYWSHHISARFSSTKSNLKQMLMLQNDCRTTHIQLLSSVICSSYKSQHTSLNCESWNMSIAVKVEIFLSLWKGLANADSAMTSTFSNNAWKKCDLPMNGHSKSQKHKHNTIPYHRHEYIYVFKTDTCFHTGML